MKIKFCYELFHQEVLYIMIGEFTKKILQKQNNMLIEFLEDFSIKHCIPIDVARFVIESTCHLSIDYDVDVQYNKSKLKLILKSAPKTIEEHLNEIKEGIDNADNAHDEMSLRLARSSGEQDCRCCDCWHYQYDHYSDGDWFRYCIFEDRTKKLPNNPHAEYKKWFCPYFDENDDDYSQIYEIYEAWKSGNDI